ncbi:MAG: HAMP domain-containing histidine kinase, partial [Muribaculaceae bacterium]|nr:HAMP domain-containing histidine kinase [Muribaculaceae bacterium]
STPVDSMVFDASGARDEGQAWLATSNVLTERKCPFAVEGIDSILHKSGIKAHIKLIEADSMVWNTTVEYHISVFTPDLTITIPYSELQGKTACIISPINPFYVLPGMWQALVITILVSCLLIICLVLQFSTVMKLARLDKMRNSFITTMIHELKRPISTLKMCISGLDNKQMVNNSEIRKELLSETRTALDNLSAYFTKLRDITFNNVEQIPLNIQNVNLRQLFHAVSGAIVIPNDKSVTFTNDIDDSIILPADPSHMFNILTNLVENAVKYSGSNVEIHACATTGRAGYIEIHISDNGYGIAPDDRRRIFDRFYRGKNSHKDIPGMGLGLAYV